MSSDLKVTLSLVDDFTKRLTGVETELGAFGKQVDHSIETVKRFGEAFIAAFAVDKLKEFAQQSIEFGEHVEDGARKLGLSVEKYQELGYVAKASGVEIDGMGKAFRALATKAEEGNSILGVATKDMNGNIRDVGDIFKDVLIKMSEIPNTTERAAVAQKLFGKTAGDVFNIASQGKEKISELTEETKRYGLILGEDSVKRLDEAKKAQDRMDGSLKVLSATLVSNFAPAIISATNSVAKFFASFNDGPGHLERVKQETVELIDKLKKMRTNGPSVIDRILYGTDGAIDEKIKQLESDLPNINKRMQDEVANTKPTSNAKSQFQEMFSKDKTKYAFAGGTGVGLAIQATTAYKQQSEAVKRLSASMIDYGDVVVSTGKITEEDNKRWSAERARYVDFEDKMTNTRLEDIKTLTEANEDFYKKGKISEEDYIKNKEIISKKEIDLNFQRAQSAMQYAGMFVNTLDMVAQASKAHGNEMKAIRISEIWIDSAAAGISAARSIWTSPGSWQEHLIETVAIEGMLTAKAAAQTSLVSQQSFSRGTNNAAGGVALVGEDGPEKVFLPKGASVATASQTRASLAGGTTAHFHFYDKNGNEVDSIKSQIRSGKWDRTILPEIARRLSLQ